MSGLDVPGRQVCGLHALESVKAGNTIGLTQLFAVDMVRVRVLVPPPHGAEHCDQSDHSEGRHVGGGGGTEHVGPVHPSWHKHARSERCMDQRTQRTSSRDTGSARGRTKHDSGQQRAPPIRLTNCHTPTFAACTYRAFPVVSTATRAWTRCSSGVQDAAHRNGDDDER